MTLTIQELINQVLQAKPIPNWPPESPPQPLRAFADLTDLPLDEQEIEQLLASGDSDDQRRVLAAWYRDGAYQSVRKFFGMALDKLGSAGALMQALAYLQIFSQDPHRLVKIEQHVGPLMKELRDREPPEFTDLYRAFHNFIRGRSALSSAPVEPDKPSKPTEKPASAMSSPKQLDESEPARPSTPGRPGQPVTLALASGVEMALMPVPAGPFLMGSDPLRDEDAQTGEQPQHVVHLGGYLIGRYLVTNAQYAVFVRSADHCPPIGWKGMQPPSGEENHPVVNVSWEDAAAFCAWLTELLRAALRGSGESLVARLPTEAEWEKAARGTDGRIYPWGDEKPTAKLCNFGNNVKGTTAVGRYSPAGDSPYGCADMAGNVWEWCADWYADDYYTAAPDRNPTGPRDGVRRVMRGGSFDFTVNYVRCAYRFSWTPDYRYLDFGFRLVASPFTSRSPQPPKPEISRSGDVGGDNPAPFAGGRIELDAPLPPPKPSRPPLPSFPPARPGQPVTLALAPAVELELLPVSVGPFLMGSDPDRDEDTREREMPQHVVHLDAYVIGRYPVTNAQYAIFVQAAGHRAPSGWNLGRLPSGKENHPVVEVSWDDAVAFCAWLTKLLKAARGGESLVARLPTEAEWEKAARGDDGRIYPWGDARPTSKLCNFGSNVRGTTAVGRYGPAGDSPYGCADMAGNVWEWCADWYADDYYAAAPDRNPTGPRDGGYRVLRGGSFGLADTGVRCAFRFWDGPGFRDATDGFRVVTSPFTSDL